MVTQRVQRLENRVLLLDFLYSCSLVNLRLSPGIRTASGLHLFLIVSTRDECYDPRFLR